MTFKLLSTANPKTQKGSKLGYLTFILHLAPADVSGHETCAKRTPGCTAACLNTAGRGGMFKRGENTNTIQKARIRKTQLFFADRAEFMRQLVADVRKAVRQAARLGLTPVFRLNGTSDLQWSTIPVGEYSNIFEMFPDIQFYDYTAVPKRLLQNIPNYHLTFSAKESNDADIKKAIDAGANIAVVFDLKKSQPLPDTYLGIPVINADLHDLRFLDKKQVICGLYLKGNSKMKALAKESGFARKVIFF